VSNEFYYALAGLLALGGIAAMSAELRETPHNGTKSAKIAKQSKNNNGAGQAAKTDSKGNNNSGGNAKSNFGSRAAGVQTGGASRAGFPAKGSSKGDTAVTTGFGGARSNTGVSQRNGSSAIGTGSAKSFSGGGGGMRTSSNTGGQYGGTAPVVKIPTVSKRSAK
jgi:hypothetical protein